jgi:hypothetical protein
VEKLVTPPKSEALRTMYWRSEILQVMYWLRGEKFGLGPDYDQADPPLLERFLGVDANVGIQYLDRLVEEGDLVRVGDRYALSERGRKEGALEFATSFDELTRPAHGECSDDCWCHNSPEEAEACAEERAQHQHEHDGHNH